MNETDIFVLFTSLGIFIIVILGMCFAFTWQQIHFLKKDRLRIEDILRTSAKEIRDEIRQINNAIEQRIKK